MTRQRQITDALERLSPITTRPVRNDIDRIRTMTAAEWEELMVRKYGPDFETKEFSYE